MPRLLLLFSQSLAQLPHPTPSPARTDLDGDRYLWDPREKLSAEHRQAPGDLVEAKAAKVLFATPRSPAPILLEGREGREREGEDNREPSLPVLLTAYTFDHSSLCKHENPVWVFD